MTEIHIPAGINFECTGCGNCCLEWPVPVTANDVDKIKSLCSRDGASAISWFKPLASSQLKLKQFTHTLEKQADGKCTFLSPEKRCRLHEEYGSESKPAMCQLFPYTFNPTPSGVYASLSFASSGVLFNSGLPLTEQEDLLQEKWNLFCRLFPDMQADWSNIQAVDGVALSWDEYLSLDQVFLQMLSDKDGGPIEKRLLSCSRYLRNNLPAGFNLQQEPKVEARPKVIDQLLVVYLRRLYLPDDVFANTQTDLDTASLMQDLVRPPQSVKFQRGGSGFTIAQISNQPLGNLEAPVEDLLYRFVYCRLFAKLYFGFGWANLSVLVGLHHLIVIIALLRIELKMMSITGSGGMVKFEDLCELVRTVERRLTQVNLSPAAKTCLEVLLTNPERIERILSLAE